MAETASTVNASVARGSKTQTALQNQIQALFSDLQVMYEHATSEGISVPQPIAAKYGEMAPKASAIVEGAGLGDFAAVISVGSEVHAVLSALVAPATPRTLQATAGLEKWSTNALLRNLLVAAAVALIGFVIAMATNALQETWRNQLIWFWAALLGATFYSLFTAHKYIVSRTFDPRYESVYVIRMMLGVVSGVILGNFGNTLNLGQALNANTGGPRKELLTALFALLGGYSSEAVNQILLRVSDTLVAVVKGRGDSEVRAKEKEIKSVKAKAALGAAREQGAAGDDAKRK